MPLGLNVAKFRSFTSNLIIACFGYRFEKLVIMTPTHVNLY